MSDPQQQPQGAAPPDNAGRFRLEVDGAPENRAADAVLKLKENVQYWVARGRYNKVRIKRGGKAILPDIPVGALVAFEAATFFWTGLLRGALFNTVGRVLFEVELINEAEEHYRRGLEHFLAGELQEAEALLSKAVRVDERHIKAHLQLGVLRKVQGREAEARRHFERVVALEPTTDVAREATVHLKKLNA